MKLLQILILVSMLPVVSIAQSSSDHWKRMFNPKAAEQDQKQRIVDWYHSWNGRLCMPSDVKQYWRLTLLKPAPGSMDANANEVGRHNAQINYSIDSGAWNFDAQEIADQLNIYVFRTKGKEAEAIALEQLRAQRQFAYQQQLQQDRALAAQLFQQSIITSQLRNLNDQLWLLRQQIR